MKHGRRDRNHPGIVKGLRDVGASVLDLGDVAKGCPDILVGWRGRNYLLEIKDGEKPPSQRDLTDDQKAFHLAWRGQVGVVLDLEAALAIINGGGK